MVAHWRFLPVSPSFQPVDDRQTQPVPILLKWKRRLADPADADP
jgi:hypothetical protein